MNVCIFLGKIEKIRLMLETMNTISSFYRTLLLC